jgi:Uma2 family endonuclease
MRILLFIVLLMCQINIYGMEMKTENRKIVIFIKEQLQEERISRANYDLEPALVFEIDKKNNRKESVKKKRRVYKQSRGDRDMIRKQMAAEIFLREQENGSYDNEILQFLHGDKK